MLPLLYGALVSTSLDAGNDQFSASVVDASREVRHHPPLHDARQLQGMVYAKANRFGETVSLLPLHANNLRLGVNSLL